MIKILCILSQLLYGNRDCIEIIYKKKKLIEHNEILKYYLLNGFKNDMIYTYNIFSLKTNNEYYLSIEDDISEKYIDVSKGEERILSLKNDEEIHANFFKTIYLFQCLKDWSWIRKGLNYNVRYCNHIIIKCLKLDGFIRKAKKSYEMIDEIYREFEEPTMKEKIKSLNMIKKIHGCTYLEMIMNEFSNYDIFVCVIISENGNVESVMGNHMEYQNPS